MFINANLPYWRAHILRSHLTGKTDSGTEPCMIFGVASLVGQVPLFHVMTECGAARWRVPLNFLVRDPNISSPSSLDETYFWNCPSSHVSVTVFNWLKDSKCLAKIKGNTLHSRYLMTLDWTDEDFPTEATDTQEHKPGHILTTDEGRFICVPTNSVLFSVEGWTDKQWNWPSDWTWNESRWHVHTEICPPKYHYGDDQDYVSDD